MADDDEQLYRRFVAPYRRANRTDPPTEVVRAAVSLRAIPVAGSERATATVLPRSVRGCDALDRHASGAAGPCLSRSY
jgi:hypothetical protein